MTEPERPTDAIPPGNPSPEEISARLEALLKRTHTLRAQRAASGADGASDMSWPPPDRELDHYDVVDIAEGAKPALPAATATGSRAEAAPAPALEPAADTAGFGRPDWSELRLRSPGDDPAHRSPWLWVLTSLLALATVGQAAYIWHLHATRPAQESGHLRVDAPGGAQVRVNGQAIGATPVDHALEAGTYEVEVVRPEGIARVDGVRLDRGRTVVLVFPPTPAPAVSTPDVPAAAKPPAPATVTAPAPPSTIASGRPEPQQSAPSQSALPTVSATTGAVVIESTPPGLPVTMGGRPRGVTPVTIGQVRPGRHDVLVGGTARQVDVTAGEVATLRVP